MKGVDTFPWGNTQVCRYASWKLRLKGNDKRPISQSQHPKTPWFCIGALIEKVASSLETTFDQFGSKHQWSLRPPSNTRPPEQKRSPVARLQRWLGRPIVPERPPGMMGTFSFSTGSVLICTSLSCSRIHYYYIVFKALLSANVWLLKLKSMLKSAISSRKRMCRDVQLVPVGRRWRHKWWWSRHGIRVTATTTWYLSKDPAVAECLTQRLRWWSLSRRYSPEAATSLPEVWLVRLECRQV